MVESSVAEEWRSVIGFEKFYAVSRVGVKSLRTGRMLKDALSHGYPMGMEVLWEVIDKSELMKSQ